MSDIETRLRDGLRYDGAAGLDPSELIHRAQRRRLTHRLGVGLAVGALGLTGFGLGATWLHTGDDRPTRGDDPLSASDTPPPPITTLNSRDRITTAGGAVIEVTPTRLCVGNVDEKPSCLMGSDIELRGETYSFYTESPDNFVYAWLVPAETTAATLQIDEASPLQASLYRIQGRSLLVAIVTGATCWGPGTDVLEQGVNTAGDPTYTRESTDPTCP